VTISASSSARSFVSCLKAKSSFERWESDEWRQAEKASDAAATASSTSAEDANATCLVSLPVEGS